MATRRWPIWCGKCPRPDPRAAEQRVSVFSRFWDAHSDPRSDGSIPDHWRETFDEARQRVHRALAQQDTERVLYEVFVRLYTLRNQLMHGGATWNGAVNRARCAMAGRCWRRCPPCWA